MSTVSPANETIAVAVRLADEGVPLRAIARATLIPSPALYERLVEAKTDGRLLSLPRDDWPPGCPRDQRALQLSRLAAENHAALVRSIQRAFRLARKPAQLLLLLTQHEVVPRERVDIDSKSFGVHVCKMRQHLHQYGIKIITLWGFGYQLSPDDRRKAMELILAQACPAT